MKKTKNTKPLQGKDAVPASKAVPQAEEQPKYRPGQQLKLANTNIHDDMLEMLTNSQSIADKFYSSRTLKSSIELRKVYLQIAKIALLERKRIIQARKSKNAK